MQMPETPEKRPEKAPPAAEKQWEAAAGQRLAKRLRGPCVAGDPDDVYVRSGPDHVYMRLGPDDVYVRSRNYVTMQTEWCHKQLAPSDHFWDASGTWECWYGKWYNPDTDVWWHSLQAG